MGGGYWAVMGGRGVTENIINLFINNRTAYQVNIIFFNNSFDQSEDDYFILVNFLLSREFCSSSNRGLSILGFIETRFI